jgi:hypothetical protein
MEAARSPLPDDIAALKAALALATAEAAQVKAINADLEARNALLELQNEKMRRALYGQRSERGRQLVDQIELAFEELEASASEDEALAALAAAKTNVTAFEPKRPSRKPLPEHRPRESVVIPANGFLPDISALSCPPVCLTTPERQVPVTSTLVSKNELLKHPAYRSH